MLTKCAEIANARFKSQFGPGEESRNLTDAELNAIESNIRQSMRKLSMTKKEEWANMSLEQKLGEAAAMAKDWHTKSIVEAQKNEIINAQRVAEQDTLRRTFEPGSQVQGIVQSNFHDAGYKGSSLEMRIQGTRMDFMRLLHELPSFDPGKFFGLIQDMTMQRHFIKEMFGEDSQNPNAKYVADMFQKVNNLLLNRRERAGIGIHELDNWGMPQYWDSMKVGRSKAAFVDFWMANADRSAYVHSDGTLMKDDEFRTLLEDTIWPTLASEGANKRVAAADNQPTSGARPSGGVGLNRNAPRQLFFKDSGAYIKGMELFGEPMTAYELMLSHLNRMTKEIAVAETWGRNPESAFRAQLDKAFLTDTMALAEKNLSEKAYKKARTKLESRYDAALRMFDATLYGEKVGSEVWANRAASIRGWESATKLFGAISSIPDIVSVMMNARSIGIPQMRVASQMLKGGFSGDTKKILEMVGLLSEGQRAAATRMAGEELGHHVTQWVSEAAQTLGLMRMADRATRSAVALPWMQTLGELSRQHTFESLLQSEHAQWAELYGFTKPMWDVLQLTKLDGGPNGNYKLLTPDSIYGVDNHDIQQLVMDNLLEKANQREQALAELDKVSADAKDQRELARDQALAELDSSPDGRKYLHAMDTADMSRSAELAQAKSLPHSERTAAVAAINAKHRLAMEFINNSKEGLAYRDGKEAIKADFEKAKAEAAANEIRTRKAIDANSSLADVIQSRIEKLNKRTETEQEWLTKAQDRADAAETKARNWLKNLVDRSKAKMADMESGTDTNGAAILYRAEKIKLEAEIAQAEREARMSGQLNRFMADIKIGMENYGGMRDQQGVALGRRLRELKAMKANLVTDDAKANNDLEAQIAEAEHNIAAYTATKKRMGLMETAADALSWKLRKSSARSFKSGQELGMDLARLNERLKELDDRLAMERKVQSEKVDRNTRKIDARFNALNDELVARDREYTSRRLQRGELIQEYNKILDDTVGREADNLRSSTATHMLGALSSELQVAARGSAGPTVADKEWLGLLNNPRGTLTGELLRTALFMRSTMFGMFKTHMLDRPMRNGDMASRKQYIAKFVVYTTMAGAMVEVLKALVKGQNLPDLTDEDTAAKFIIKSMLSGGGASVFGDLLFADPTAYSTVARLVGGVGVGVLEDAYAMFQGAKAELDPNIADKRNFSGRALDFVRRDGLPFANLFWSKMAFDRMLYRPLIDAVDPNHTRNQTKRNMRNGTSFWWRPDEAAPHGFPEIRPQ